MKTIGPILVLAVGSMSNASGQVTDDAPFEEYSAPASRFTMLAPNWNNKKSNDRLNVISRRRADNQCYFDLNVVEAKLDQYREVVQNWAQQKNATIVSASPLVYDMTTPDGKYTFRTKTHGLYCDSKTYFASSACVSSNYDDDMVDLMFDSMRCGGAAAKAPAPAPPVQQIATTPAPKFGPKADPIDSTSNASSQVTDDAPFEEYSAPASRFTMLAPNWNNKKSNDRLNVISRRRADNQCYFDLNVVEAKLDQYREVVQNWAEKKNATIVSTSPLVYDMTTPDGKYTFRTRTHGLYCDGKTYFASSACLRSNYDDDMVDLMFDSMRCGGAAAKAPAPAPPVQQIATTPAPKFGPKADPKLGLIISPEKKFSRKTVKGAYRVAREGGAEITRHYIVWGKMENKLGKRRWKNNDWIIDITRDSGIRVSVTFLIIRTAILGALPADIEFKGWDDPVLTTTFTDFALDYLERYGDVVDYVEIGAEVNAYFRRHPDELDDFAIFFKNVYDGIKRRFPTIKVGTVLAYHEMRDAGEFSAYHKLNIGDFVGFTLYIYGENYAFDRDPDSVRTYLDEIADLTAGRPFALEEVGCSPWPSLKGTEQSQKDAVAQFFDFFEAAPTGLEFMNWFILHDGAQSDCDKIARSFVKRGSRLANDKEVMRVFADFLCHLGLRANDGTPRAAWNEYSARAKHLGENPARL